MELTPAQILHISKGKPHEIAQFITVLLEQNRQLKETVERQAKEIVKLETRVKELERQLGTHSGNSTNRLPLTDSANLRACVNLEGKRGLPKTIRDIL